MKNINKKLKISKLSLLFYVLACLSLLYTCYSTYVSYDYIKSAMENGAISWNSGFHEIIKYYMTYSSPYAFYTLAFVFFGYVSNFIATFTKEKIERHKESIEGLKEDKSIEDVFEESIDVEEKIQNQK